MNVPIGCDKEGARAYLGCSEYAWKKLRARRLVKEIWPGWFSYEDLKLAMDNLRKERDMLDSRVIDYAKETKSRAKAGRVMGSEGDRPLRTSEELLR